ncbi:MAG: GntR family transcriptional regulator [Firmicutes bacterium]|nr:GntR family transcriptional regulator [Bacillota bacterium]
MRNRIDSVYNKIREGILAGKYAPSQHLVEAQLAQEYGVGRHIVRLALERLDATGLVTIEPNRGAIVARLTLEEAIDILLAREVLEGAAARLAADRISDEALDRLAELIAQMRAALDNRDYDCYTETNVQFHKVIYDACGSRKIPELIASLRARVVRYQFRTALIPGRAEQSLAEHGAIYESLRVRDGRKAEEAMRTHIAMLRQTLQEAWELLGV